MLRNMDFGLVDEAIELLEKSNAELEPELLSSSHARELLDRYARARRLVDFGVAALARKVDDASQVAKATGTSMGSAKATVATGRVLRDAGEFSAAFQAGHLSLDQAAEIAKAEESAPGAARELLKVAEEKAFHVLKDRARAIKLDAEQRRGLAERQREARSARSYSDELGMVHVHLALEPHVGTPIVARAEAEASRLARASKAATKEGGKEPFERFLADAYAALLSGSGKGRAKRPELVVLVSHEVAKRGWNDVRDGEVCKIPGVGPIPPQVAKQIAKDDAFLNGLFFDGVDLRDFKRWGRHIPIEVAIALELGEPPDFDGIACVDCGNRFRTEFDHVEPHAAGGPTSHGNFKPRCRGCHLAKTERDRRAGKLRPPEP
jgi:HNH endonuclease